MKNNLKKIKLIMKIKKKLNCMKILMNLNFEINLNHCLKILKNVKENRNYQI